tara:strand:+ start:9971 stop:11173 length:1203 start_codon:yes stop_codon:yes gene_type:complete
MLLSSSPFNIAHIELAPGKDDSRFKKAALLLNEWIEQNILIRDNEPKYYLYEQKCVIQNQTYNRRSVFVALRIYDPQDDIVRPHESTMVGPRRTRLNLMKATNANVSPIFAMYEDPTKKIHPILEKISEEEPDFESQDINNDLHRLWVISDDQLLNTITAIISNSKITIADGHHRYATATDYLNEENTKIKVNSLNPKNYLLTGLIEINDPGLRILPNHRLISKKYTQNWEKSLANFFITKDHSHELTMNADGAEKLLDLIAQQGKEKFSVGVIDNQGKRFISITAQSQEKIIENMPKKLSTNSKHVDASILTELILSPVFDIGESETTAGEVLFTASATEAFELIQSSKAEIAFLVNPTPVQQVIDIANVGDVMPQKTTFFYPKLATGLVLNVLDDHSL